MTSTPSDCVSDHRQLSALPVALLLTLWLGSCASPPTAGQPRHDPLTAPTAAEATAPAKRTAPGQPKPTSQEQQKHSPPLPANAFELAVGLEDYWLSYRHLLRPQGDYGAVEWFGDEDDNYLVSARIMRFTQRTKEFPLTFGVGLGLYGAFQDRPSYDAYAVSLRASAHYNFDTHIPTHAGVHFAYAPDITTFSDGEQLIDAEASYGMQLSPWASTFVAYRYTEVEWTNNTDHVFTDQIHVGIRLAW